MHGGVGADHYAEEGEQQYVIFYMWTMNIQVRVYQSS